LGSENRGCSGPHLHPRVRRLLVLAQLSAFGIAPQPRTDPNQAGYICDLDTISRQDIWAPSPGCAPPGPCSCALDRKPCVLVWDVSHRLPRTSAASSPTSLPPAMLWRRRRPGGLEQVGCKEFLAVCAFKARVELEFDRKRREGLLHFAMDPG